jgi:hypothetical protein
MNISTLLVCDGHYSLLVENENLVVFVEIEVSVVLVELKTIIRISQWEIKPARINYYHY